MEMHFTDNLLESDDLAGFFTSHQSSDTVRFKVGPHYEIVETKRSLLMNASNKLADHFINGWDIYVNLDTCILLPYYNAEAFKLFVKILETNEPLTIPLLHSWLPVYNMMFYLNEISRDFSVTSIHSPLQVIIKNFISFLTVFVDKKEFLDLSETALCEILFNEYPVKHVKLFSRIVKWAENRCAQKQIPISHINVRNEIGGIIYHIRFTSMTLEEFETECVQYLSEQERMAISNYIKLDEEGKKSFDAKDMLFRLP